MRKLIQTQIVILGSLVTAFALTLAACGGGGSSAGAGGGGTTVFGSVNNGVAALDRDVHTPRTGSLLALGNLVVPTAQAAVYSVTLACTGGFNSTVNTDANGKFTFVGDATLSGSCNVSVNGALVTTVDVLPGTSNEVEINDTGGGFTLAKVESKPGSNEFEVEVEDERSDQASNDQNSQDSTDDNSDQASTDQDSQDSTDSNNAPS